MCFMGTNDEIKISNSFFYSHIDSVEIYQAKDNMPIEQWSSWFWLFSPRASGS